jgi:glycosyltransferase involved in cell wall biosynthesis
MVSIIIPTLGRPSLDRLLRSILEAVKKNELHIGRDVEVLVAVDPRGAVALRSDFNEVKVVPSKGFGVNRARNAGARASRGDLLWFLDDDTELLSPFALLKLPELFVNERVQAVGGDYVSADSVQMSERGYNSLCSLWRASAGHENSEQLLGGTLAVRRVSWSNVGGFDDHIEYGGAETAFVTRLNLLGRQKADSAGERPEVRFDETLNVLHYPGSRGLRGWAKVAFRQGRRKTETESSLPNLEHRVRRTLHFLKRQDPLTIVSLTLFAVPFLTVSKLAAISRR